MESCVLVAVENAAIDFDKCYSYRVPAQMKQSAVPGCRCTVPFGGGNKKRTGIILEIAEAEDISRLKPLFAVIDSVPLINGEGLFLLKYLRETTFCTWFDALKLLIPAGIGINYQNYYSAQAFDAESLPPASLEIYEYLALKRNPVEESVLCGEFGISQNDPRLMLLIETGAAQKAERAKQRILDEKQVMVRIIEDYDKRSLTAKQKKAAEFLEENETASLKEVCYYAQVTRVVVNGLVKRGAAEYFECDTFRNPYANAKISDDAPTELSKRQQEVFESLKQLCGEKKNEAALLHGVTGSGKTEVFLKLVEYVTSLGKTAIVLVPEISLTAQAVENFHRRFGKKVAVLHSGLTLGQRTDEWKRIKQKDASVVIGTRSAVFAPLENIGLIVIDEEQEHTYKSDKTPRYHARDVASTRCAHHGALLLLSSATPSIESYYAAKTGKYKLFNLETRFNKSLLPYVDIIDMGDAGNVSAYSYLSCALLEGLHDNLANGEQSILLLNRRGYSTIVKCSSCGEVAQCPNCSIALTYHNANDSLVCHYCGHMRRKSDACTVCGSNLVRYAGQGTQKLEQELNDLFADARILRVDMDTTMSRFSHEKLFGSFLSGEYDIMIGTQMVAKGLNFPNVTLVGVINADQSLYSSDFRSFERTFSLLTQVVGRSGRGDKRGRAVIQTYAPDNPVITLAAGQSYPDFYEQEIKLRKLHLYPPFCSVCGIVFSGEDINAVIKGANSFAQEFKITAAESYADLPARLLGPAPGDILKIAGKYRYKLILKCKNNRGTRQLLRQLSLWFQKESKKVKISIDMHYDR